MKIAVVTTFYPNAADPLRAVFVRNLVRAIAVRERVTVISPVAVAAGSGMRRESPGPHVIPEREIQEGIEVLYPRFRVVPGLSLLNGLSFGRAIGPILGELRQLGAIDVIQAHCAYPDAVGAALAASRLKLPLAITAHGSDINVYSRRRTLAPQIRWALRRASAVVGVSRTLCGKITELAPDIAGRLHHIPCAGFDPRVFRPMDRHAVRASLGLPPAARVVLFVGQLVPIKGLDILLEAWRILRERGKVNADDRLLLIGEGPLRVELERRACVEPTTGTVQFLGGMPQASVARWLAACNLFCLPSRNEGFPNVIVEALACGVPVVASDVGGVHEVISSSVNGIMFPSGDSTALAAAIDSALTEDWNMSTVAASAKPYTWRSIADQNLQLLRGICGDCRGAGA